LTSSDLLRLAPLEVASGYVFGTTGAVPALPSGGATPTGAFEDAVRHALQHPPAVVAFSGGRDSSAVLAVAAAVARREGLPAPVPATLRFPQSAESDETAWQERVVAHLGLDDWVRVEITDELDCVGPFATRALRRHGLMWPPNAHVLVPLLEQARGGSLVTGDGGDLVLQASPWSERVVEVLGRRTSSTPRDLLRIALAFGPRRMRARRLARRYPEPIRAPWLHPHALAEVVDAWSRDAAAEPLPLDTRIRWGWRLRAVRFALSSFSALAADEGVDLVHPFNEPTFVAAIARAARSFRYADRTEAMRILFADVLPEEICARTTKGGFRDVFWNRHARRFGEEWNGEGADPTIVDVAALQALWRSPQAREHFRSCTQLQAAWLARHRSANGTSGSEPLEQPLDRLGHRFPGTRSAEAPAGEHGEVEERRRGPRGREQ
jgi:asparagine synthetase B (glutamine-hydrolysing)